MYEKKYPLRNPFIDKVVVIIYKKRLTQMYARESYYFSLPFCLVTIDGYFVGWNLLNLDSNVGNFPHPTSQDSHCKVGVYRSKRTSPKILRPYTSKVVSILVRGAYREKVGRNLRKHLFSISL